MEVEQQKKQAELIEFLKAKKVKEDAKKANEIKVAANSKRKLESNLNKRFRTCMIGSLAKFEERFGHLWGHGLEDEDLTEEQLRYKEIWDVVRTEILNNGNNQMRGSSDELSRYTVMWNGYQISFPIKQDTQEK